MSEVIVPYRFVVKRDTAAAFTAANTLLKSGEWALETDTRKMKMGDGTTAWNSLAYFDAGFLHTTGNETATGNKTFSGNITHGGAIANTGILSPSQITANTDNYAPTGHASVYQFRLTTDASRNLTGLQGGASGRMALLTNVGGFALVLTHDATSAAANRFYCPGSRDLTLAAGDSALVRYDSTASRWRVVTTTKGATALQSIVAGTNVTVDTTDPANPIVSAGGGGSGAMSLVGTAIVSGAAATTLTLSGLDMSTAGSYLLQIALENGSGSATNLSLYYNSDTTATNYERQSMNGNSGLTGARSNDGIICSIAAGETATGRIEIINDRDGKPRAISQISRDSVTSIRLDLAAHGWNSATNVTSITLSSSVASALAIGSSMKVFKLG